MTYARRKVRMVYSHFKGYRMALRAIREGQNLPQCVYALSYDAAISMIFFMIKSTLSVATLGFKMP